MRLSARRSSGVFGLAPILLEQLQVHAQAGERVLDLVDEAAGERAGIGELLGAARLFLRLGFLFRVGIHFKKLPNAECRLPNGPASLAPTCIRQSAIGIRQSFSVSLALDLLLLFPSAPLCG